MCKRAADTYCQGRNWRVNWRGGRGGGVGWVNIHLAVVLDELLSKLVVMLQLYVQYCLAIYLLTCSVILAQLNKHKQQKMKFSRMSWIMNMFIVTFMFISSIKKIFY